MIDIHTHILPKVDDGAQDIIESIKMLKQAEEDGIRTIVCTPHILKMDDFKKESIYFKRLEELKQLSRDEGINIDLLLGSEIYIQPDLVLNSKMATLNNNGTYFLVEFPMGSIPRFSAELFFQFIADGKIPVIAHPERNVGFLQHPDFAYKFVQRGALLQINAGSLRGHFGSEVKKLAHKLMDHNLVHFIASDCHNYRKRKCQLKKTWGLVVEKWGEEVARELFIENPKLILVGKEFTPVEPIPIGTNKNGLWKTVLNGMNKFWK